MIIPPGRFLPVPAVTGMLFGPALSSFASGDSDGSEVRISFVDGDVRLSRRDGKPAGLKKPWEQGRGGELLEHGFAVATGIGRAEIEFENGSTVYLAENSLLLFTELSAPGDRIVTRMTLPTGTATFSLLPAASESFFIQTPTDKIEITSPDTCFARIDAYLDAIAITPQGEQGEKVVREDVPKLVIPKGQTMFFQGGEVVPQSDPVQAHPLGGKNVLFPCNLSEVEDAMSALGASGQALLGRGSSDLQSLPSADAANAQSEQSQPSQSIEELGHSAASRSQAAANWDHWVSSRVQERAAITTAALKASGLFSPIPGLHELYTHGSFFQCEPYGTCWEPASEEPEQAPSLQSRQPSAQSPAQNAPNRGFQPQTVEWTERVWSVCDSSTARRVSRVARTQQELEDLLRLKAAADRAPLHGPTYADSCWNGTWIHHHGRYARVLAPRIPPRCVGKACKVVHPPHPIWVRAGRKLGFVPL